MAFASVSIGTVSLVLLVSMLVGRLVGWLVSRMIRCWWLRFVCSVDGGFDEGFVCKEIGERRQENVSGNKRGILHRVQNIILCKSLLFQNSVS